MYVKMSNIPNFYLKGIQNGRIKKAAHKIMCCPRQYLKGRLNLEFLGFYKMSKHFF